MKTILIKQLIQEQLSLLKEDFEEQQERLKVNAIADLVASRVNNFINVCKQLQAENQPFSLNNLCKHQDELQCAWEVGYDSVSGYSSTAKYYRADVCKLHASDYQNNQGLEKVNIPSLYKLYGFNIQIYFVVSQYAKLPSLLYKFKTLPIVIYRNQINYKTNTLNVDISDQIVKGLSKLTANENRKLMFKKNKTKVICPIPYVQELVDNVWDEGMRKQLYINDDNLNRYYNMLSIINTNGKDFPWQQIRDYIEQNPNCIETANYISSLNNDNDIFNTFVEITQTLLDEIKNRNQNDIGSVTKHKKINVHTRLNDFNADKQLNVKYNIKDNRMKKNGRPQVIASVQMVDDDDNIITVDNSQPKFATYMENDDIINAKERAWLVLRHIVKQYERKGYHIL